MGAVHSLYPDGPPVPQARYTAPPRCPDEIVMSSLPDWCVRVWLAVRGIQGNNPHTEAGLKYIADRAGKSKTQASRALSILAELGWIEVLHTGRPSHYRCLLGSDDSDRVKAAVKAFQGASKRHGSKLRGGQLSGGNLRGGQLEVARGATSPDTPYKEQSSIESGEKEMPRVRARGSAQDGSGETPVDTPEAAPEAAPAEAPALGLGIDDLPDGPARYRSQIEALLASPVLGRRQFAYRALRAGQLPQATVVAVLDEAEARAGPVATYAAIAVTANEAEAFSHSARLSHFNQVLASLEDHAFKLAHPADDTERDELDSNTGGTGSPGGPMGKPGGSTGGNGSAPRRTGRVARQPAKRGAHGPGFDG